MRSGGSSGGRLATDAGDSGDGSGEDEKEQNTGRVARPREERNTERVEGTKRERGKRETTLLSRRCVARMATQTQGVARRVSTPCLSLVPAGT